MSSTIIGKMNYPKHGKKSKEGNCYIHNFHPFPLFHPLFFLVRSPRKPQIASTDNVQTYTARSP